MKLLMEMTHLFRLNQSIGVVIFMMTLAGCSFESHPDCQAMKQAASEEILFRAATLCIESGEASHGELLKSHWARVGQLNIGDTKRIQDLEAIVDLDPENADAIWELAQSYEMAGSLEKALEQYSRHLEFDVNVEKTYRRRGEVYLKLGDYDSALYDYNSSKGASAGRGYGFSVYWVHTIPLEERHYWEEMEDRIRGNDAFYEQATAYIGRGLMLEHWGEYEEAYNAYSDAIWKADHEPAPYGYRALFHYRRGQYRHALRDFDSAIDLEPEALPIWHLHRANVRIALKQYDNAIFELKLALFFGHNLASTYLLRARAYAAKGSGLKAIKDYNKVLDKESGFKPAYLERGKVYFEMGHIGLALRDFDRAVEGLSGVREPMLLVHFYAPLPAPSPMDEAYLLNELNES